MTLKPETFTLAAGIFGLGLDQDQPRDLTTCHFSLKLLEVTNPGFAGSERFGLRDKLKELKRQVDKQVGGGK